MLSLSFHTSHQVIPNSGEIIHSGFKIKVYLNLNPDAIDMEHSKYK